MGAGEPGADRKRVNAYWVYPRGCGGTRTAAPEGTRARGLSPRVRGNPASFGRGEVLARSIPVGAGEPEQQHQKVLELGVYPRGCGGTQRPSDGAKCWLGLPRGCGGTWASMSASAAITGLSPWVRGNLRRRRDADQVRRSIPAGAGEPGM